MHLVLLTVQSCKCKLADKSTVYILGIAGGLLDLCSYLERRCEKGQMRTPGRLFLIQKKKKDEKHVFSLFSPI